MSSAHPARHLLRAKDLADVRFAEPLTVDDMAAAAKLSRAHFSRAFTATFGQSPPIPTCRPGDSSGPQRCCGRRIARWPTSACRWDCRASDRSPRASRAHSARRRPRTVIRSHPRPPMLTYPRACCGSTRGLDRRVASNVRNRPQRRPSSFRRQHTGRRPPHPRGRNFGSTTGRTRPNTNQSERCTP